jgi:hypothetical protein
MSKLRNDERRILVLNIMAAVISGVILSYFVLWPRSGEEPHHEELIKLVFLAVGSYGLATVFLHAARKRKVISSIPGWIIMPIVGSIIMVSYFCVSSIYIYVVHPLDWQYKLHPSLSGRISAELLGTIPGFFVLSTVCSVLTMSIAAMVYALGWLILKSKIITKAQKQ